jgi:hypothetical protein
VEVSCRRMSLFLKDTHESHDSIRKPLVRTGNRAHDSSPLLLKAGGNLIRRCASPPPSSSRFPQNSVNP